MLNKARIRAYTRLIETSMRTFEEIDNTYVIAVYVELIASGKYTLADVDPLYVEAVKKELGI